MRTGRAEAVRRARGCRENCGVLSNDRRRPSCRDQLQWRRTDFCDPALFERAVGNLVDNALRFTPENGSIEIALADGPTDFEVAVSDNGSGIAPEHLPRVFDRFYRAEPSRGSDGAGLGLALVK